MRAASRLRPLRAALAALVLLPAGLDAAQAGCTRRITNRSALTLVGSQNGGPAFVLPPGHSRTVRLAAPGQFDLLATCGPAGSVVADLHVPYEAVLDRCYVEIGTNVLASTFGRGFLGLQGTGPFAVNAPRQGDIVLGPGANEACLIR
ncbi:conserved hypothetical protein [Methylobacterium sp. 4-46]|uniref:hypothetical protein n=1 Tax=unclassified Methylobacterium TaxID=2615210 RepID=UPI000152D4CD|nr:MULTISPECIES: hypothetical protein [Methylobacterium]ACA20572.1 conserved hypothetical protein [Methylobacterium sp. 4-46]WFT79737.1 hypothetical protein QA634_31855 [Methylobacterium nodulans]